jgi:hypothetical protein
MRFYRPPMAIFGLIDSSIDELPYVHTLIKVKEAKKKQPAKRKSKPKKAVAKKGKKKRTDGDESELINEEDEAEEEQEELNQSENDEEDKENNDKNGGDIVAEVDLQKLAPYFRDFDLKIINFVNLELDLSDPYDGTASSDENDSIQSLSNIDILNTRPKIKPHLLNYALTDFNRKLTSIFKISSASVSPLSASLQSASNNKTTKAQLFMQLNTVDAQHLAHHLIEQNCLDMIFNHINTIAHHIKEIQTKYDGMKDPNELVNNPKNIQLLKCLNQALKLLITLFTWLNSNDETKMMSQVMKKHTPVSGSSDKAPPELYFYNYVAKLKDVILDLSTSQILIQFLDLLCNKVILKRQSQLKNYEKKFRLILIEACKEFLLNDYNIKVNSVFSSKQSSNEAVKTILQIMLQNNDETHSMDLVEKLCHTVASEDFILDRQSCDTFNTLKLHFISYYKTLLEFTVDHLRFIERYDYNRIDSDENLKKEVLKTIKRMTEMHSSLVMLKKHSKSFKEINILTVLKCSKLFLNMFMKLHMPWLDKAFDDYKEHVVKILEQVQKSVVYLQEYCLTNTQNAAVVKQTPLYVRCVEAFSFRIKQMFFVNNVDEAFSVNLFQNKLVKNGSNNNKKGGRKSSGKEGREAAAAREEDEEVENVDSNADEDEEDEIQDEE